MNNDLTFTIKPFTFADFLTTEKKKKYYLFRLPLVTFSIPNSPTDKKYRAVP